MCTALSFVTKDHYFGRNLDLEYSYNETITITPRNYPFVFRKAKELKNHYAMIGMAYVVDGYPLYYEASNEKGLSAAGLNFPDNAVYRKEEFRKDNIASFEFIPWILGQCSNLIEAREKLSNLNITDENFNSELCAAPLHWLISDKNGSITVESVEDGLKVYDNPVGLLTNNPTFEVHMFNLINYMSLSNKEPLNNFSDKLNLKPYSRGMGGMGLPGDLSSSSRFVKAAFTKLNSVSGDSEEESISQFFHILGSVAQQRGCVDLGSGKYEITIYSSCCNVDKGIYYYTTYENRQINCVDMCLENLDSNSVISYPIIDKQQIFVQNKK